MAGIGDSWASRRPLAGMTLRTWRATILALAVAMLVTGCALGEDIPAPERRAQQLNKAIMCPVCPGESIDQSQNPLAGQMRAIVADKLEQGWNEQQIQVFFVERYGPSILLEPPRRGFALMVWLLPPVALLGAGVILYVALRLMRRTSATATGTPGDEVWLSDAERQDYFRRIEATLDDDSSVVTHVKGDRAPPSGKEAVPPSWDRRGD